MRYSALIVLLILSPEAGAQLAVTVSSLNDVATITVSPRPGISLSALTGAPYSAKESLDRERTLADGTHIAQKTSFTSYWRDSAGRTRKERDLSIGSPDEEPARFVEILDAVEGADYVLDPASGIAHRVRVEARRTHGSTWQGDPPVMPPRTVQRPDGTTFSVVFLELRTMAGLAVWGTRTTTQYPPGSSMGNDRPAEATNETWISPQLGVTMLSKASDPRFGDTIIELRDILLGEPDPTLMRPPAGYRIVDENGPFEIIIRKR